MIVPFAAALLAGAPALSPAPASPLVVTTRVLVERRTVAPDGSVRIATVPGVRAAPGDRLVIEIAYRNAGRAPIGGLSVGDAVPAAMRYRGPATGTPEPEVSLDGARFATLAELHTAAAAPAAAPAAAVPAAPATDAVVAVRWRIAEPLPAGGAGTLRFRAVLR